MLQYMDFFRETLLMKHGFLWICTCVLRSGWAPDVTLHLLPPYEHWWVLRREFSKTSWEIGNFWDSSSASLDWNKTAGHAEMEHWVFRFCWFVGQEKGNVGTLTQVGTECALFTLCSLGAHVKDPVLGCWQIWCWSSCPKWLCWPYV